MTKISDKNKAVKKAPKNKPLKSKERHLLFVNEYIIDFNGTRAYMAVYKGISYDSARVLSHELLTNINIQALIKQSLDKRIERLQISQDRVVHELMKMAFSDISTYVLVNDNGVKIRDLTNTDTTMISEISENATSTGINKKIKMYSKEKALELLGKHLAMFTDKTEVTHTATDELLNIIKGAYDKRKGD